MKEIENTRMRKVKKAWLFLLTKVAHKGYKVKMDGRGNKDRVKKFSIKTATA